MRVLFTVRDLGVARPSSIAARLGISRQLASYHLAALVELGFVRREGRHYRV